MTPYHVPVMLKETLELLSIDPNGIYVDVTYGGGGHSREILARLGAGGKLIAFDQDADAKRNLVEDERLEFVASNFAFIESALEAQQIEGVDGIIADLGISSHQIDTPDRGFAQIPFPESRPSSNRVSREQDRWRTEACVLERRGIRNLYVAPVGCIPQYHLVADGGRQNFSVR